jgi:hypothetical protein
MNHSSTTIFGPLPLLLFALLLPACEKAPQTGSAEPSKPETVKAPETGSVEIAKPEAAKAPEPNEFEAALIQRFEGNQRDADAIIERVQQSSEGEGTDAASETTAEGEGDAPATKATEEGKADAPASEPTNAAPVAE